MSAPPAAEVEPDADVTPRSAGSWHRLLIVFAVAATLLFVGATGGLLIGLPGRPAAPPAADSVDVGFAQDMTVHHQQGVQMAGWERDHGTDPVIVLLASDIEATQTGQIGRMQGWLELWGAASLPTGGYMAWMANAPGHDHSGADPATGGLPTMPGMASSDELRALRSATGPQLDVLFLQLMLRHHEGGATMMRFAAEHAAQPEVRNLATQMLSSQTAESEYLRRLLSERGGTPLPL